VESKLATPAVLPLHAVCCVCTPVPPACSDTESETEFAAWAIFGGPMILATDPRNMSAWKASVLNADIIAGAWDLTSSSPLPRMPAAVSPLLSHRPR